MDFNKAPGNNPLGLYPAYKLYENGAYGRLVERFGIPSVFILSAGWGLIRADFLTPYYDITYSKNPKVPKFKRRNKSDKYDDFRMLPDDTQEEIVFFGGMDYLPQFCKLTAGVRGKRIVFYNSIATPRVGDCALKRFGIRGLSIVLPAKHPSMLLMGFSQISTGTLALQLDVMLALKAAPFESKIQLTVKLIPNYS